MAKFLIICEHNGGNLKRTAKELLSFAKATNQEAYAVAVGEGSSKLASQVGGYGIKKLFFSEQTSVAKFNPEVYTAFYANLAKDVSPDYILASATSASRDFLPRLAARLPATCASDCTGLKWVNNQVLATKPLYAGKCVAEVEFQNANCKIILVRANQLPAEDLSGPTQLEEKPVPPTDLRAVVKEIVQGTSKRMDLTEANIIVSGGRGLKGPENFKMLEELADVLGATVGASRAVCDAGWMPHSMQVGQTGKTVAPSLYIAVAISGAIQHLAGMSGSKVIVAINSDPEAPIFKKATYGIVGDAIEIVPLLTSEFKRVLQA